MDVSSSSRPPKEPLNWRLNVTVCSIFVWALSWVGAIVFSGSIAEIVCRCISVAASAAVVLSFGRRIANWYVFAGLIFLSTLSGILSVSLTPRQISRQSLNLLALLDGNVKAALCAVALLAAIYRGRVWRLLALSLPILIWMMLIYIAIITPQAATDVLLSGRPLPTWLDVALQQLTCLALLGFILAFIDPVREVWRTFIQK